MSQAKKRKKQKVVKRATVRKEAPVQSKNKKMVKAVSVLKADKLHVLRENAGVAAAPVAPVSVPPPPAKKRNPFARKPGAPVIKHKRRRKPGEKGATDFVDNAALLSEVIKSKRKLAENPSLGNAAMTKELSDMLMMLVNQYATKANWMNYSYKDEFIGDAILHLFRKWDKFDETRWNNPFAFFTQIVYRCFLTTLGKEKKQQRIKDIMLENMGLSSSHSRVLDYRRTENERISVEEPDVQERADTDVADKAED